MSETLFSVYYCPVRLFVVRRRHGTIVASASLS
jgi:hypothetical protein